MTSGTSWQPRSWADMRETGSVFDMDSELLLQERNSKLWALKFLVELALHLNTAQPPPDTSLFICIYLLFRIFSFFKKCPVPPLVLPSVWPQVQSITVKLLTKH